MRQHHKFKTLVLAMGLLGVVSASGIVACKKKSSKQAAAAPAPSPSATPAPAPVTPAAPQTPSTPPTTPPTTGSVTGLTCISSGFFGMGTPKTVVIDELGLKMSVAENGSNAENYTLTKVSSSFLYPASPRYEAIPQTSTSGASAQKGTVIVNTHDFGSKKGKKQLIMSSVPYLNAKGESSISAMIECP